MTPNRILVLMMLAIFVLSACSPATDSTSTPCDEEVSWEQAIEILNSGEVVSLAQLHNLEVSFVLENGCTIETIEPRIDDIFAEVQKCGEPCAMITLATE